MRPIGLFLLLGVLPFWDILQVSGSTEAGATTATTWVANGTTESELWSTARTEEVREEWIKTELFLKDASAKAIRSILPMLLQGSGGGGISPPCTNSIMKTILGIKQLRLWAFKMLDTSGKLPNGIFSGSLSSLGDYDGCLSVDVPGKSPFQGQYCTVMIRPPLPPRTPFHNNNRQLPYLVNVTKEGSAISDLLDKAPFFYYLYLRTSLCLPSTCTKSDVQHVADKVIESTGLKWQVNITNCEIKESVHFSNGDIGIMVLLGIILLSSLVATILDVVLNLRCKDTKLRVLEESVLTRTILCFSVYNNTKRLLKRDDSPDSIKVFYGMKVVTMLWVILNHTYHYTNFQVLGGLNKVRDMGKEIPFQMISNGFLNVETFFFISAVLVTYGRMKSSEKQFNVFLLIFRRLWRLTPPVMLVIATSMLIPQMGSGPAWKETVGQLVEACRSKWWTNLLYFNNFVKPEDVCFQWTWYIPVDTHLYFVALFAIIPLKRRPKHGLAVVGILFAVGIIATVVNNVYYGLMPTAIYVYSHPDDINYFVHNGYFKSYLHLTTCCVGMAAGYILATKKTLKIPMVANVCGWLVAIVSSLTVLYGAYDWNQGNVPGIVLSTVYTCTNKVTWSLALAWVTIACCTGNGGIVKSFLSWSAFVPLSRLTFMAYLIHPIIQHMYVGSTRQIMEGDHRTLVFQYLAHVVLAYSFAYLLSLLFESPFMCLEKIMLSPRQPRHARDCKSEGNGIHVPAIPMKEANGLCVVHVGAKPENGTT